jgi:separase
MCESLVFLCPRLCLRYLGNSPEARSPTRDIIRYEQRKTFISNPALHAIDSALFLVKVLLTDGRSTWDLIDSKLQDCLCLLDRLGSSSSSSQLTDTSSSYYIRISNLYYTQYVNMQRDGDGKKESHLVRALRRSIDSIRTRPTSEKKTAQFSTKLERMAQLCKTSGRYDELSRTLSDLRDEMIANGVLASVAEVARSQPLKAAWSQEEEAAVLGRTIHSLLRVCVKYLKTTSQIELCSSSWPSDQKGVILEHELELLLNPTHDSVVAADLRKKIIQEALSIYNNEQYPIRRLRVLTRLISVNLSGVGDFAGILTLELGTSKLESLVVSGTEDQHLSSYLGHFKALALTTLELQQEKPKLCVLAHGIAVWSSILSRSQDLTAFEREVDCVNELVTHLHAIAGYQQMKGYDAERISTLQLIADITELCDSPSTPDGLVLGFTDLSTQWIQLGYSGKAGLALDRARIYSRRNGVSTYASLRLHLASCEYMIAIGRFDKV